MRPLVWLSACAVVALAFTSPATAQEFTFRLSVIPVANTFYVQTANTLPERIGKATNGRVKIEVYDSLVPGNQLASAVRDGRVDMSGVIHPYLSSEEPRLTVSNLPGLVNTIGEYRKLLDSFWREEMAGIWLEKYNSVLLTDGAWGEQVLFTKKPVLKVEDFKGIKVRVHNTETAHLMNALGAKPTPISAAEMLPALQRGVVDGIITAVDTAYSQGFDTVAEHMQVWRIAPLAGWAFIINREAWERLPNDLQEAMRAEMKAIENERFDNYEAAVRDLTEKWKQKGIAYHEIPAAEAEKVRSARYADAVYEAWYKRMDELGQDGRAFVQRAKAALGK